MEKQTYTKIESVRYTGGHSTRKPSTVTIAIPHKIALDIAAMVEDYDKKGLVPDVGIIGVELTLRHAEEVDLADAVDEMGDKLSEATEPEVDLETIDE